MKVTIVTAVLNCVNYIGGCLTSVRNQDYKNLEHIIIDGGSTDGTLALLENYKGHPIYVLSERDNGVYDALNKGIAIANGDLIGVLSADDWLASRDVISAIVHCAESSSCHAVYGHLNFIARNRKGLLSRKWNSQPYSRRCLENGWMPPHPAFYVKKSALGSDTPYSMKYGTCGDYDFILHLLYRKRIEAVFIDKLIVCMRAGGMSNGPLLNIFMAWVHDYRILADHQIPKPLWAVFRKKIQKLKQFRISPPD